jgi:hypothetical protein
MKKEFRITNQLDVSFVFFFPSVNEEQSSLFRQFSVASAAVFRSKLKAEMFEKE